jgi:dipeptidyl aminopeptidase/acylaminoacyl peptidase
MKASLLAALSFLLSIAAASAQNPPANSAVLVFRDHVVPHWFAGPDGTTNRFWYRVRTGIAQFEFVLVDAATGTSSPAFDHTRLARALADATGHSVDEKNLPVQDLEFAHDGKSIVLRLPASSWRLALETYSLSPVNEPSQEHRLPVGRVPRASTSSGPETELTLVNRLSSDVDLFWVDQDGKRVPYGTIRAGERRQQHSFAGHVWLVTSNQGSVLAVFEAEERPGLAIIDNSEFNGVQRRRGNGGPRAASQRSSDGNWEVLVRGDNLFLRDTRQPKDQQRQLTFDGNPNSTYARNADTERSIEMNYDTRAPETPTPEVYWAPDSSHFVAMRLQPGTQRRVYLIESSPEDQLQPKLDSYPYLKPGDQVPIRKPHLFDLKTKKELPVSDSLFSNPWSISDLRWSSSSAGFTFLYNQRGHQVLRVVAVDARFGDARPVVDESSDTFIDYSGKLFSRYIDKSDELLWASERDGWNHLYLYDLRAGRVKNQITHGDWVVRSVERVDEEKRQVWFQAGGIRPGQDPYYLHLCRVNFDGTGLKILTEGEGNHAEQFSPDRAWFIDTWSRVDLPPATELRRSSDGSLVCQLEQADAGPLLATGRKMPERFVAKGRDGTTEIYGVIWRPKDFNPSKKYPVIEDIYAGPQGFFTPKDFRASCQQQELADHGFIVVQMDGMGTSGRSKMFHDISWKNLGDAGFPDRIRWLQAAAATHPFMDLTRVGIYGTSAGGQNALRGMLDHGDFYKVCVSDSGCHDNRMDKIWWNEQWMGWPVDASYERSSNVKDAHKLQGKLLLMVGEMDRNVDPSSTMQVVNALIKADKDFDLLFMPGAGHGVARTSYGARRLEEFFVRNLLGTEIKIVAGTSSQTPSAP